MKQFCMAGLDPNTGEILWMSTQGTPFPDDMIPVELDNIAAIPVSEGSQETVQGTVTLAADIFMFEIDTSHPDKNFDMTQQWVGAKEIHENMTIAPDRSGVTVNLPEVAQAVKKPTRDSDIKAELAPVVTQEYAAAGVPEEEMKQFFSQQFHKPVNDVAQDMTYIEIQDARRHIQNP